MATHRESLHLVPLTPESEKWVEDTYQQYATKCNGTDDNMCFISIRCHCVDNVLAVNPTAQEIASVETLWITTLKRNAESGRRCMAYYEFYYTLGNLYVDCWDGSQKAFRAAVECYEAAVAYNRPEADGWWKGRTLSRLARIHRNPSRFGFVDTEPDLTKYHDYRARLVRVRNAPCEEAHEQWVADPVDNYHDALFFARLAVKRPFGGDAGWDKTSMRILAILLTVCPEEDEEVHTEDERRLEVLGYYRKLMMRYSLNHQAWFQEPTKLPLSELDNPYPIGKDFKIEDGHEKAEEHTATAHWCVSFLRSFPSKVDFYADQARLIESELMRAAGDSVRFVTGEVHRLGRLGKEYPDGYRTPRTLPMAPEADVKLAHALLDAFLADVDGKIPLNMSGRIPTVYLLKIGLILKHSPDRSHQTYNNVLKAIASCLQAVLARMHAHQEFAMKECGALTKQLFPAIFPMLLFPQQERFSTFVVGRDHECAVSFDAVVQALNALDAQSPILGKGSYFHRMRLELNNNYEEVKAARHAGGEVAAKKAVAKLSIGCENRLRKLTRQIKALETQGHVAAVEAPSDATAVPAAIASEQFDQNDRELTLDEMSTIILEHDELFAYQSTFFEVLKQFKTVSEIVQSGRIDARASAQAPEKIVSALIKFVPYVGEALSAAVTAGAAAYRNSDLKSRCEMFRRLSRCAPPTFPLLENLAVLITFKNRNRIKAFCDKDTSQDSVAQRARAFLVNQFENLSVPFEVIDIYEMLAYKEATKLLEALTNGKRFERTQIIQKNTPQVLELMKSLESDKEYLEDRYGTTERPEGSATATTAPAAANANDTPARRSDDKDNAVEPQGPCGCQLM